MLLAYKRQDLRSHRPLEGALPPGCSLLSYCLRHRVPQAIRAKRILQAIRDRHGRQSNELRRTRSAASGALTFSEGGEKGGQVNFERFMDAAMDPISDKTEWRQQLDRIDPRLPEAKLEQRPIADQTW